MPDRNILDARVPLTNMVDSRLEATRERNPIGFELLPALFKLALSSVIERLPVVVDDQAADLDSASRQSIEGVDQFFFGKMLS